MKLSNSMHFSTKHYRVVDRIWIHSHHFFPTNPWKIQALIGQRYCSPSSIWIWTHCAYQPGGDLKSCFLMKKVCTYEMFRHFCKYFGIFENMLAFLKIFWYFWKYFGISENILVFLKTLRHFWKYFDISENI